MNAPVLPIPIDKYKSNLAVSLVIPVIFIFNIPVDTKISVAVAVPLIRVKS